MSAFSANTFLSACTIFMLNALVTTLLVHRALIVSLTK